MRFRYSGKIRCGLLFFGVFLCGFAVFGPPLRPPQHDLTAIISPYNTTRSALHKPQRSDKKGRETEKKTANVQMPRTVGVVRPVNPILHNMFFYVQALFYIVRDIPALKPTSRSIKQKLHTQNIASTLF